MVAQFRVVSGLDFVIVIIVMSFFLVVLGCSDDDSVSLSSPTVPVMSASVSPANSSLLSLEPIKRCNCTKFKLLMIFMLWSGCCSLLLGNKTKPRCLSMHWLHKNI